ncbi:MAG: GNAT family N-acetyltransferase [Myxococcota bacterium]
MGSNEANNKSPIQIREMDLEDLPRVYALGEQLFTPERWPTLYRTWDGHELADLYASDGDTCFVAELDGDIVGFALGTLLEKRKSPWKYGWVLWLGVSPSLGRRGLGKRLLSRITDVFVEYGARMILIDTDPTNRAAMKFFRNEGFGQEQPHVYMAKNLTRDPAYVRHRAKRKGTKAPVSARGVGGSGVDIPVAPPDSKR